MSIVEILLTNAINYENNQSFFVQCINTTEYQYYNAWVAYGTLWELKRSHLSTASV